MPTRGRYGVIDYEYYDPFSEYLGTLETPFLSPLLASPRPHPGLTTAFIPPLPACTLPHYTPPFARRNSVYRPLANFSPSLLTHSSPKPPTAHLYVFSAAQFCGLPTVHRNLPITPCPPSRFLYCILRQLPTTLCPPPTAPFTFSPLHTLRRLPTAHCPRSLAAFTSHRILSARAHLTAHLLCPRQCLLL